MEQEPAVDPAAAEPIAAGPAVLPYGSWPSPIRIDDIVGAVVRLSDPWIDGDDVYWIEGRPAEGGRSVLVRRSGDGYTADRTPPPFDVRSRVHEYGGGAYTVAGGTAVFSNVLDGRLYRLDPGDDAPQPITPDGPYRYADLRFDAPRRRFLAIREDHSGEGDPVAAIVDVPLDGDRRPRVLVQGPRLPGRAAPVARRPAAGVARVGPPGHAVGRDPAARRGVRQGRLARTGRPGRRRSRRVDRPARVGAGRRAALRQRPHRLVEPVPPGRGTAAPAARPARGRVRRPGVGLRPLVLRVPAERLDRGRRPRAWPRPAVPHRPRQPGRRGRVAVHRRRHDPGRSAAGVVANVGTPTEPPTIVSLDPATLAASGVLRHSTSLLDRPALHLGARGHHVPDGRWPRGARPVLPRRSTPTRSAPTASCRRSSCARTAARRRTRSTRSSSGSST